MKVLKHGNKKDKFTGGCTNCKCKVECLESEATWVDGDNSAPGRYVVDCPDCSRPITLKHTASRLKEFDNSGD